jgi:threonine dehydrogenase-like Zn-dependent dehydrogenase
MLAVHLEEGRVEVREIPIPRRPKGSALIRLLCAGICNTDLELQRGYYGFRGTPGHEFVGEVVEADDRAWVGRRVVGEINLACGKCDWCARGLGRHCLNRTVLGIVNHPGAFSEYFTLPERNLHVVPDELPTERATFTEPVAAACEILEQVAISPGEKVAVLGDGKLGLLVAQVLHAHGSRVTLYGRHESKLLIASRRGIATECKGAVPRGAFRWVVEATGSAQGLKQAVNMVVPRGTVIMKSTVHGQVSIDTAPVIVNEITLVGSRCGPFAPALELLRVPALCVEPMISDRIPLSDAPRGFGLASQKQNLKILLTTERA